MATSHSMTNNLPQLTHPDGSPIRALVVDDEPSLSELMSMGLRMAGWSVAVAADGPEAVKLAKDFRPDVLVLDVMLPGFDGVELLGRIRAFAPEVPALFLTAKDAVQDRITESAGTKFVFECSDAAKEFLLGEGIDLKYGARHLKRAIERFLVYPLSNLVATQQVETGDFVMVDFDAEKGGITLS